MFTLGMDLKTKIASFRFKIYFAIDKTYTTTYPIGV